MKKLLLVLTLISSIVITSCSSSDDDAAKSQFSATIDGVPYVFNTFAIEKEQYDGYTDVNITASIDGDTSKVISMVVEQGAVGLDASWYFAYFLDNLAYAKDPAAFTTDITESTANRVVGTFAGEVLAADGSGDKIIITNGVFDIRH